MSILSPIVVDLGGVRKKDVGDFHTGAGPIVEDIEVVMRSVRANANLDGAKRVFLPIVVVYEQA
jgi:hypothetical protein